MKKYWILYLLIIVLIHPAGSNSASKQQSYTQSGTTAQETSADWGQIRLDGGIPVG